MITIFKLILLLFCLKCFLFQTPGDLGSSETNLGSNTSVQNSNSFENDASSENTAETSSNSNQENIENTSSNNNLENTSEKSSESTSENTSGTSENSSDNTSEKTAESTSQDSDIYSSLGDAIERNAEENTSDNADKTSTDNTSGNAEDNTSNNADKSSTEDSSNTDENTYDNADETSEDNTNYFENTDSTLDDNTYNYEDNLPITNPNTQNLNKIYENIPVRINLIRDQNETFEFESQNLYQGIKVALLVTPYQKKQETGFISIYMTYENSTPNATHHNMSCREVLMGFTPPCTIPYPTSNSNETEKQTLKMMIICEADYCDVKLRIIHEMDFFIKPETKELYSFDREEAELFSFETPKSFSRIILSVHFKNLVENIYEKRMNQPEEVLGFSSGDPKIIRSNDHILALFNNTDEKLCTACNVSFYMTSKLGMIIELELFVYNISTSNLQIFHEYYDYIQGSNPILYEIDISEQDIPLENSSEKLFFTLNSISGSEKNLYVNGDSNPYLLESFRWNSTLKQYYEEEDIIISRADIQSAHITGKKFFMAVKSNRPGLYKIEVKLSTAPFVKLASGVTESSVVSHNSIDYYEFELFVTQDIVEVKVVNEKGNVDVYGRICKFDESCTVITNQDITDKKDIDFMSETEGNDKLKIEPKCPLNHPYCYILIAVRGYSLVTDSNKYSITIGRKNGIVSLLENKNHESHVGFGELTKFKFILDDPNRDIENITFKVTNDLHYIVSKNDECSELNTTCQLLYGDTRHPIVFKKEQDPMDGIYYINIIGIKNTNFFIFPQVRRTNKEKKPIKLSEGKPYRDFLNIHSQYEYFTFHLSIETLVNLEINLQANRNKLEILVCDDGKLPSNDHYNWKSRSNFLRIPQDVDPVKGSFEKIFIVRVSPIKKSEFIELNKTIEFGIVYSTDKTIKTLERNHILHDSVQEKSFKFYLLFVDHTDETISFTTHVINPAHLSSALKMYISASPYPQYYTYNTTFFTDFDTEKLVLKKQNLVDICGADNHHCPIYLAIENTDTSNEITFSLLVEIKDYAIQLKEGFEQKFVITEQFFRSYFIPICKDQELDIFVYSNKEHFELFVNIIHDTNHLVNTPSFETSYPTNLNNQFKSILNNQHSFNLKSKLGLEACWPDCVVLLTIAFPLNELNKEFPVYVLISDDQTEFSEGKPLIFTLESSKTKYITYDLMDIYKSFDNNAGIILTLTPFYGQATIYLTVSMNDNKIRPSVKNHQFFTYTDHIELNRTQLLKLLVLKNSEVLKTLKLLICVYGVSDGKFLLNVFSSKMLNPHLLSGLPQDILLASDFKLTFQYYNTNFRVLRIFFNRESGLGSIMITPCNPQIETENTYDKCIKKNSSYFSIVTGTGSSSYIRISETTESDYCKYCVYLITVTSVTNLKGSLMVYHPQSLISLQEGKKTFDAIHASDQSKYVLVMQDFKEFEIIVTVFSGKPEICFSYHFIKDNKVCDYSKTKHSENGLISMRIPAKITSGNLPLQDSELFSDVHSHFNSYFIIVSSSDKSEYSITYIQSIAQTLQSGVISYDTILSKEKKIYVHNYYDLDASPHLTFSCLGLCHIKDIVLATKMRPLRNDDPAADRIIHLDIDPLFTTNSTMTYKLPKEKVSFEFEIINKADHELNYSLVINGRDLSILPLDSNFQGILEGKHARYYEITVAKKGYLALELMNCFGEVEIMVSHDYSKVLKEEFEEEFSPLKDQPFIHLLKVNKGMIYIAMRNPKNIDAAFEFNIHFYEVFMDIPQTRLSGEPINANFVNEEHKLNILIRPISCSDCSAKELHSTNITYYAIVAENETVLNIAGKCGITHMPGSGLDIKNLDALTSKTVTIPLMESNNSKELMIDIDLYPKEGTTTYYVSIKAVIDYLGEKKLVNMYYPNMEVVIGRSFIKSSAFIWVVAVLCLGVAFGCCLCGVHYYGKYKIIQKKLLYELEDPKNITQVSGINLYEPHNVSSIEMESKTYQGLNQ